MIGLLRFLGEVRGCDLVMCVGAVPARMKENVMQVPATLLTMKLSDIV